ncbi:MAG TPA: hypothetical protein VMV46_23330 [Thermoanaerobaculia bacterium]|nr:hypothetical protein [Thermoanaerobaculia bacterium]
MLRTRVVRELLFEVAGLRRPHDPDDAERGADDEAFRREDQREEIAQARRRATFVVVLDAAAVALLLFLRDPARGFLVIGRSEEALFTLGILLIAGHLGFRLAQLLVLRNLERAWEDLPEDG